MYFNKLYSESGFLRDLAFKKLFLETPEFFTFVYEYSLQLLGLPFDDTVDLLDNNVNDNINIKNRESDLLYESNKYLINIEGNSQTSISVNLKKLSYLCALLLRQVKPGEEDEIKTVIQININNHSPFKTKNFINITKLIDSITGEVRNGQIAIVDFNLDYYDKTLNVVVEFNGDFWHANPYKNINPERFENKCGLTIEEKWKKDKVRNEFIESYLNTKVFVVWEKDFRNNKEECVQKIVSEINEYVNRGNYNKLDL